MPLKNVRLAASAAYVMNTTSAPTQTHTVSIATTTNTAAQWVQQAGKSMPHKNYEFFRHLSNNKTIYHYTYRVIQQQYINKYINTIHRHRLSKFGAPGTCIYHAQIW
jgi:hypothetical protein